jgi:hypothetical protein
MVFQGIALRTDEQASALPINPNGNQGVEAGFRHQARHGEIAGVAVCGGIESLKKRQRFPQFPFREFQFGLRFDHVILPDEALEHEL